MKKMLAFALVAVMALPAVAFAQTMAVSADGGDGVFVQAFDVPGGGASFDMVIWADTAGSDTNSAEFVTTALNTEYGIFQTGLVKLNGALDLGDNALGEFVLAFGACIAPSSQLEMVRITYVDFTGGVPADTVVPVRGLQPGDTQPSSFNGESGFVACDNTKFPAPMGGVDGGFTGAGVTFPDGSLVLNPTPAVVDNETASMGQVKARF